MSAHSQRRTLLSVLVVVALVVAVVGAFALRTGGGGKARDREAAAERTGSHEMAEALEKHPGLARNRLPLAFVSEKLEQQGGEASGEIVNGPNQESYDERAFPRTAIAAAQQRNAKAAAAQAKARGRTGGGETTLATAQGTAAPVAWSSLGPDGGLQVKEATYTGTPAYVSGRVTALATGSTCTATACTVFAGTAGGGLWRTGNGLADNPTWTSIGSDLPSTAIGSITRTSDGTLYVGTGEPNGSSDSEAGLGLFRSTDGGGSFSKVTTVVAGTDFTLNRSVGAVAVDPSDAQHLLVGTAVARHGSSSVNGGRFTPPDAAKVGLYESRNGGGTWTLALSQASDSVNPSTPNGSDFFRGGISKIAFDPSTKGTVYASMFDYGLFRATSAGGAWNQIYTIKTPGDPATGLDNRVEFALASLAGKKTRIYLGDATYFDNAAAALLRTDDGKASTPSWTLLSDKTPGTPGYGSYNFCQGQCSYDMAVTSPTGQPNEVFLSGSMNYDELQAFGGPGSSNGRSIVRSADAGVHVTDMTNDAQAQTNGLHPDEHALVFAPTNGAETFFSGSDGGVWRQSGPYVNHSADCAARGLSGAELTDCQQYLSAIPTRNQSLNKGLQTLQFQSVSVGPRGTLQGGTQDNGTWESDQSGFAETIGGDGGQSGFNAGDPSIRYHSYYDPQHDVSFTGGDPQGWDWISDRLLASGEAASFYTPFTVDPVVAGTVFDGLQHVWRTQDNGGDRAFLDKYCNELTGDYGHRPAPCGDFVPLGGNGSGDLSGGDPGNYVVAVERAPSDRSTLWAATRRGNLFVSTNADASSASSVKFRQFDQDLALPHRFPSGVFVDPRNPLHAFVSYSGYSAYAAGGHVYEVTVDPQTGKGTAKDLSADLGDQPVTDIVYVASTQSLFASTDFGVVTRTLANPTWVGTQGLPPVAVYGLTYDQGAGRLYAATHGRSVWTTSVG